MALRRTKLARKTSLVRKGIKRPVAKKKSTRGKLKPKKTPLKKLRAEVWELCKQITRKLYQNEDGTWNCYTCGRLIDVPAKAQTGHFLARSICGLYLRFDLRNLRIQDYFCNINLGGNGSVFYQKLLEEKGEAYLAELFSDKTRETKETVQFYEELKAKYKTLLETL